MKNICHSCGKEAVKHEQEVTFPWRGVEKQHVLTVTVPVFSCACGEEWTGHEAEQAMHNACMAAE